VTAISTTLLRRIPSCFIRLEDPTPEYCGSLAQFVNFVIECYEQGAIAVDEDGRLDGVDDGYFQRLREFQSSLN
jgi:hypothetical protein